MTRHTPNTMRLLPWEGPEGNPCYLVGGGTGYVSRVADDVERAQLGMVGDLLDHVDDLLTVRRAPGTTPLRPGPHG